MMLTGACSEGDGGQRTLLKRTAHSLPAVPPAAQTLGTSHPPVQAGAIAPPFRCPGYTVPPLGVTVPPVQTPRATGPLLQTPEATGSPLPATGPPRFIVIARTPIARFIPANSKTATFTPVRPSVQDAKTGKFLFDIPLPPGVKSSWQVLAAAPDNRTFVLSGWTGPDSPIRFFRIHLDEKGRPGTPVLIPEFGTDPLDLGYVIALSPDGTRLAYAFGILGGVTVSVVDLSTGHRRDWSTRQPDMVSSLAWAPNGHDLALASSRGGLRILDVSRPGSELFGATRLVKAVEGFWPLGSVAYAPDGKTLIYAVRSAIERISVTGGRTAAGSRSVGQAQNRISHGCLQPRRNGTSPALRRGVAVVPARSRQWPGHKSSDPGG